MPKNPLALLREVPSKCVHYVPWIYAGQLDIASWLKRCSTWLRELLFFRQFYTHCDSVIFALNTNFKQKHPPWETSFRLLLLFFFFKNRQLRGHFKNTIYDNEINGAQNLKELRTTIVVFQFCFCRNVRTNFYNWLCFCSAQQGGIFEL